MATKKITALTELSSADDADVIPIVDVSAGVTKKIQKSNLVSGGAGDVTGPDGCTDEHLAGYDDATGKLLKDSGLATTDVSDAVTKRHAATVWGTKEVDETAIGNGKVPVYRTSSGKYELEAQSGGGDVFGPATNTDSYIPQWDGADSKTLKNGIPISTFAAADHDQQHITGGGDVIPVATTSKTGLCPVLDNNSAHYLNGQGNWATPTGGGGSGDAIGVSVGFSADCDYVCDGTNDHVEIQQAIDYLYANFDGGLVKLQVGNYNIAGQIDIKNNITVLGETNPWQGYAVSNPASKKQVTRFNVPSSMTGTAAVKMGSGSRLSNIKWWYPNQQTNSTPTAYQPSIIAYTSGYISGIEIDHCDAGNTYIFFKADGATKYDSISIHDVFGYPLYRGIMIDDCLDCVYLNNIHWHPNYADNNGSYPGVTLSSWVNQNAIGFYFEKMDWAAVTSCFAFGYKYFAYQTGASTILYNACQIDCCFGGIYAYQGTSAIINACRIVAKYWTDLGLSLDPTSFAVKLEGGYGLNIVSNCLIYSCGSGIVSTSDQLEAIGNNMTKVADAATSGTNCYGIYHVGTNLLATINGNSINMAGSADYGHGIYVNTKHFSIAGNTIHGGKHGIWVGSASNNFIVIGNVSRWATTAGFKDDTGGVTKDVAHWGVT